MPHIHTDPGQHDVTVSAYIVRQIDGVWHGLVHMHKRIGKLMQIGGHLELEETPMQCLVKEVREESGYSVDELDILQPDATMLTLEWGAVQPTPLLSVTFLQSSKHYHDDYIYGLIAHDEPSMNPAEGESQDLQWLSLADMRVAVENDTMLVDALHIYEHIFTHHIDHFTSFPLSIFSQDLPSVGHGS